MKNYHNTVKFIFGLVVIFQISSIFFGFLRPSIVYDYLDYWPLTILPLILLFLFRKTNIREQVSFYSYILLIIVIIFFQVAHYIKGDFLTTYGYDSSFENLNLDSKIEHQLLIDGNNSIELNYFLGNGYKTDILNKPGNSGYPETIETLIGEPRAIIFREIDTSYLLQVEGWKVQLGSENIWKLNIFSVDSNFYLDNLNLNPSSLSGTGQIYLGANLDLSLLVLNGEYEVTVSKDLPIVVKGNAEVPASWLNATVGYLNQFDETYKLEIEIIEGSEVIFKDG